MHSSSLAAGTPAPTAQRTILIAQARRALIEHGATGSSNDATQVLPRVAPWIGRSWQRCLSAGRQPQQRVSFDAVSNASASALAEQNRSLVVAAKPVLDRLARAIVDTRYFAILTDARGFVVDVRGVPANAGRPAIDIARVGVDLSERAVGTTAIGAALAELQPVWLHRGEHFFDDTSLYSCAGAPLFGPDGRCVGMLDLTGVNTIERPELKQLAALSARSIENALVLRQPHALRVRLNWPGYEGTGESEALLCLDEDGCITASNAAAREMLQPLQVAAEIDARAGSTTTTTMTPPALHASDLFALPWTMFCDAARRTSRADSVPIDVPLWSGLRVIARAEFAGHRTNDDDRSSSAVAPERPRLRDLETALIRKAVQDARGNVAEAARVLGIGRATVYRKLGRGTRPDSR